MYSKTIPFHDYNGKARNETVTFNLDQREIYKLLEEFQSIFDWLDTIKGPERELPVDEIVAFYNNFEEILLSAWGEKSADGQYFDKVNRYKFASSALFAAAMKLFVEDPMETTKLLDGLMPKDMQETVRKQAENMEKLKNSPETPEDLKQQLAELQAKIEAQG